MSFNSTAAAAPLGPPQPPAGQPGPGQWDVRPVGGGSFSNNPGQWRFTPDATVPAGHIHIDIDAGAIAHQQQLQNNWVRHEASTPQLQGLAEGLNQEAQDVAQRIQQHENFIRGRVTKNISHLARWLNPASTCRATMCYNCFERLQQTQPW